MTAVAEARQTDMHQGRTSAAVHNHCLSFAVSDDQLRCCQKHSSRAKGLRDVHDLKMSNFQQRLDNAAVPEGQHEIASARDTCIASRTLSAMTTAWSWHLSPIATSALLAPPPPVRLAAHYASHSKRIHSPLPNKNS